MNLRRDTGPTKQAFSTVNPTIEVCSVVGFVLLLCSEACSVAVFVLFLCIEVCSVVGFDKSSKDNLPPRLSLSNNSPLFSPDVQYFEVAIL